jgi:2-oxoisovalerate dehydrogenase E2 component (dihydrolipoyl transacylase)
VLKELLVKEGEVAKVGEGLCMIEVEEEEDTNSNTEDVAPNVVHDPPPLVQSDTNTSNTQPPERRPHPMDPSVAPSLSKSAKPSHSSSVLATPSVRHLARKLGVDLAALAPGSGKGGRIEKHDVEAFLALGKAQSPNTQVKSDGDDVVELSRTRYGMWKAMTKVFLFLHS